MLHRWVGLLISTPFLNALVLKQVQFVPRSPEDRREKDGYLDAAEPQHRINAAGNSTLAVVVRIAGLREEGLLSIWKGNIRIQVFGNTMPLFINSYYIII